MDYGYSHFHDAIPVHKLQKGHKKHNAAMIVTALPPAAGKLVVDSWHVVLSGPPHLI
jgi:hypothetical protein